MARNLRKFKSKVLDVQMAGWLSGTFARTALPVLLCSVFSVSTAQSAVSGETGTIEGRAPTASGPLLVASPDGDVVENNDIVKGSWPPKGFGVSTDTTDLTLSDLDGDCDSSQGLCTATVNIAAATKVWKYNGDGLNDVMLAAPLQTYFSGKSLTVTVTAPVTTTSTTGSPDSNTQTLSSETTVRVPMTPGILVGESPGTYRWDISKGFPTTAALGFKFTVNLADGNGIAQNDFRWSTNQPSWTSVNGNGVVTFTAAPASATKTVTITARSVTNPSISEDYTFTVNKWFSSMNKAKGVWAGGKETIPPTLSSLCSTALGANFRVAEYIHDLRGNTRSGGFREVSGALYREWGVAQPDSIGYDKMLTYASAQLLPGTAYVYRAPENVGRTLEGYPTTNRHVVSFGGGGKVEVNGPVVASAVDGWTEYYLYPALGDLSSGVPSGQSPSVGSPSTLDGGSYVRDLAYKVPCVKDI